MSPTATIDAVRTGARPIEQIGALFMLHPETLAQSQASGYADPFAGYFAGRGGVLGATGSDVVNAVFAVFEPSMVARLWEQGIAVHGAARGAEIYNEQIADFGRRHLGGMQDLDRIVELGTRVIDGAPLMGLPLFAGWRAMPTAGDTPARAMQVLFRLRELRGAVHLCALSLSGLSPVEAHLLNQGIEEATLFGWSEPFTSDDGKASQKQAAEESTDRRMSGIVEAALTDDEAAELAELAQRAFETAEASART